MVIELGILEAKNVFFYVKGDEGGAGFLTGNVVPFPLSLFLVSLTLSLSLSLSIASISLCIDLFVVAIGTLTHPKTCYLSRSII